MTSLDSVIITDHQLQHDFDPVDDELEKTVKKKTTSKQSKLRLPGVSPVARETSLVAAAGKLNISKGLTITQTEMNKVNIRTFAWCHTDIILTLQLADINTWGLDVFSASRVIREGRVLTSTTFKIFQERRLCETFQIDQKILLTFLMTLEDHYLKVRY